MRSGPKALSHVLRLFLSFFSRQKIPGREYRHIPAEAAVCAFFFCFFLLFSCVTPPGTDTPAVSAPEIPAAVPQERQGPPVPWRQLVPGIDICTVTDDSVPLVFYAARIDLNGNGISVEATEPAGKEGEVTGKTVLDFARETDCIVAVNATPFDYPAGRFSNRRSVSGLYIYKGHLVSPPRSRYAALLFTTNRKALIIDEQTPEAVPGNTEYAFGGCWTVLRDGAVLPYPKQTYDSRTAAGVSSDGSIVYILTAEGEFPGESRGLSFEQTGRILKWLGAENGIQLDGGGSSSFVVKTSDGSWKQLNRSGPFGYARKTAVNFGFRFTREQKRP